MSKIAIISQAEQGVLIDISGCSSLQEAKQYLTSTLQVSSQFWEGLIVDLNLGPLVFTPEQVNEIQAIVSEVGVHPRQIYSLSPITRSSLLQCKLPMAMNADQASVSLIEADDAKSQTYLLNSLGGSSTAEHFVQEIEADASALSAECNSVTAVATLTPGMETDSAYPSAIKFYAGDEASENISLRKSSLPELWLAARSGDSTGSASKVLNDIPAAPNAYSSQTSAKSSNTGAAASTAGSARNPGTPAVLMMKQTLRSGQSVCHNGHLVIIGDVNPGAELVADGDITVWGALRGMAHAGANGNVNAEIRALKFDPIQLRIAQAIARSPDRNKGASTVSGGPETARVIEGKIRIAGSEPD